MRRTEAPACSSATASSRCSTASCRAWTSTPKPLDDFRRRAATLEGAAGIPLDDVELVAPLPIPGKIVCVGLNYKEHAAEGGRPAPTRPLLFSKFANAVIGDEEPIVRPEGSHALDLEVELGVVIGTTARRVRREDAMDHVAGYIVVNDVSARDWQGIPVALAEGEVGDGQWLRAKGSDTFLPMGSVLVTADDIPDPQACASGRGGSPAPARTTAAGS